MFASTFAQYRLRDTHAGSVIPVRHDWRAPAKKPEMQVFQACRALPGHDAPAWALALGTSSMATPARLSAATLGRRRETLLLLVLQVARGWTSSRRPDRLSRTGRAEEADPGDSPSLGKCTSCLAVLEWVAPLANLVMMIGRYSASSGPDLSFSSSPYGSGSSALSSSVSSRYSGYGSPLDEQYGGRR